VAPRLSIRCGLGWAQIGQEMHSMCFFLPCFEVSNNHIAVVVSTNDYSCTLLRSHAGAVLGRQNTSSEQPPPNMAAANLVVITNGEGCGLNGTAVAAVLINQ